MKRPFELVAEIQEKDAEIERLNVESAIKEGAIQELCAICRDKNKLITELTDALDITTQLLLVSELPVDVVNNKISENKLLRQRVREATE
jgi:hypothetical protein